MKKYLPCLLYVGLVIYGCYLLWDRFIGPVPDIAAYPLMIVSCGCMLVGLFFYGQYLGKGEVPLAELFRKKDE